MSSIALSPLGLIVDMIGAVLLWHFVVAVKLLDEARYLKGRASLRLLDPTSEQIRAYKKRLLMSRVGIGLLIAGLTRQLLGLLIDK